jgi:phosphohistidine phosphatase
VGHNPSIGHLAHVLDEEATPDGGGEADAGFPPGTAAVFEVGVPFAEVGPGRARLIDVRRPGDPRPGERPLTRG